MIEGPVQFVVFSIEVDTYERQMAYGIPCTWATFWRINHLLILMDWPWRWGKTTTSGKNSRLLRVATTLGPGWSPSNKSHSSVRVTLLLVVTLYVGLARLYRTALMTLL